MKEYKGYNSTFLSAVMLGTAPLTVWGAESFRQGNLSVMEQKIFLT